jgi:hypothetical protein
MQPSKFASECREIITHEEESVTLMESKHDGDVHPSAQHRNCRLILRIENRFDLTCKRGLSPIDDKFPIIAVENAPPSNLSSTETIEIPSTSQIKPSASKYFPAHRTNVVFGFADRKAVLNAPFSGRTRIIDSVDIASQIL